MTGSTADPRLPQPAGAKIPSHTLKTAMSPTDSRKSGVAMMMPKSPEIVELTVRPLPERARSAAPIPSGSASEERDAEARRREDEGRREPRGDDVGDFLPRLDRSA